MPEPSSSTRPRAPRRWERIAVVGLAVVVTVVVLLLLVAPGDAGTSDEHDATRNGELQALLDTWSGAVRAADRDALSAIVDAQARPGFLDAELHRADALSHLPLADWGYELGAEPAADAPGDIVARLGGADTQVRTVYLRYAIDGIDTEPTRKPVTVVVVHRADGWRLVDDEPPAGSGRVTWRGPWDFGPLVVDRVDLASGGTSLVIGHREQQALIEAVAGEMASAVDTVDRVWGTDWSRRALVLVTGSYDEFTEQVGDRHNGDEIAAVAVSDAVDPQAGRTTGQRVVFSPAAADRLTGDGLRTVLRHELTHIATRAHTVDGSPLWMLEGYADYIGYLGDDDLGAVAPTLSASVVHDGNPDTLPGDSEFAGDRSLLAYETAWSLAAFTADEYGPARLTELYRRLARGPVGDSDLDAALTAVLGVDTDAYVAAWGSWVGDRVRAHAR